MKTDKKRNNPNVNLWLKYQPILGTRLFKLGVDIARKNPKNRMIYYATVFDQVQNCAGRKRVVNGTTTIDGATQVVLELANDVQRRRHTRYVYPTRWGRPRWVGPGLPRREHGGYYHNVDVIAPWQQGTHEEKRNHRAITQFKRFFQLRGNNASGGYHLDVKLTDNVNEIDLVSRSYQRWGKRYPKTACEQFATIPRQWYTQVVKNNLHNLNAMCVLTAKHIATQPIAEMRQAYEGTNALIYSATWAEQSRGYGVTLRRGFIAASNHHYAVSTVSGINAMRSLAKVIEPLDDAARYKKLLEGYKAKYGDCLISRQLPIRLGYCLGGIDNWCDEVGIDAYANVPLSDVIDGYFEYPRDEVLNVIKLAAKKAKAYGVAY